MGEEIFSGTEAVTPHILAERPVKSFRMLPDRGCELVSFSYFPFQLLKSIVRPFRHIDATYFLLSIYVLSSFSLEVCSDIGVTASKVIEHFLYQNLWTEF